MKKYLKSKAYRKMKHINFYIFICAISISYKSVSQVGINTTSPKALLEISSENPDSPKNTDGILIPRVNNLPVLNPDEAQNGMLLFLNNNSPDKPEGFYWWNYEKAKWLSVVDVKKINDLSDGKSDEDGSSLFLGKSSGANDDGTKNANIGVGYESLTSNTTGENNTAIGIYSLKSNTTGIGNIAVGFESLTSNTIGNKNTAIGIYSLKSNTSGFGNLAVGYKSLTSNTTGSGNIAVGYETLTSNTTGVNNTAIGIYSLASNTTGGGNTAIGIHSLTSNTTGKRNTAIGIQSLESNTTGQYNTAIGSKTLSKNTEGNNNTAIGTYSLSNSSTGQYNTAMGYASLYSNESGQENTVVGHRAGYSNVNGNGNVFLGFNSGYNETGDDKLYIDNSNTEKPLIYGDFSLDKLGINTNQTPNQYNSKGFVLKASESLPSVPSETDFSLEGYSLYVKGGILTEEITVASGWADYVFEPNYNLLPLAEVEQFIKSKGHLPNVPSAKKIHESGLKMGEMIRIQQEKIEELTLYLIDLKKELNLLKSKLIRQE